MKKNTSNIFLLMLFIVTFASCNNNRNNKLVSLLDKWINQEINLCNIEQLVLGDTIGLAKSKGFIIVNWIDSTGCTSCQLKLNLWESFIKNINTISKQPVSLIFVSNSNAPDLKRIFRLSNKYPVFSINKKSQFPLEEFLSNKYVNTVLLDYNKRIVTVGNPI